MDVSDDRLVRVLSNPTNRAIVTALDGIEGDVSLQELAERVDSSLEDDSERTVDQLRVSFHHTYLPQLEEVGLLEYRPSENTVRKTPRLEPTSGPAELLAELHSQFQSVSTSADHDVTVTESSETLYEYGREIADAADEELFLIYTSAELLDEDCLPHAKDALERDVDFYAGGKNPDVRQFFKQTLPNATIWEPQMDWLNKQATSPTISRLIVADRRTVVIGLWDEGNDGSRTEIGLVGEGENNPLVVLVRELLGPRLDHLDYQSEHFLEDLPF